MNKKNISIIVQLKQNNNYIASGIEQNDAGVLFDLKIMDGLKAFNYSGYSVVTLKIQKPDGTFTYDSSTGDTVDTTDPVNGRLKLNIPTSCTAQNGMHFCQIGFGYDGETYFETTSFNYFVGENPNPNNNNIIGTNEFPILNNLIAEVSNAIAQENTRVMSENDRVEAEKERQNAMATLMALYTDVLSAINDAAQTAYTLIDEVNRAIAQGGSVDISTISALATKSYVASQLASMTYDFNDKATPLIIRHEDIDEVTSLAEGELLYDPNSKTLYVGESGGTSKSLNDPCFSASALAPTDTTKLWIDISGTASVIKYYNGSAWVSCNTAVFG